MADPAPDPTVLVSQESFNDPDPYRLVHSNITVVNYLRESSYRLDDLAPDALRSYFVDYYLAQVNNGAFSQFVYNSRWNPAVVRLVREGLSAIGARQHLALFERGAVLVESLATAERAAYFESSYFGDNATRDDLNVLTEEFYTLNKTENLLQLNSQWLRQLPILRVLPLVRLEEEVARRAAQAPAPAARKTGTNDDESRRQQVAWALCQLAGLELVGVAGPGSVRYQGRSVAATQLATDEGDYFWFEENERAYLVSERGKVVAEIEMDVFGSEE